MSTPKIAPHVARAAEILVERYAALSAIATGKDANYTTILTYVLSTITDDAERAKITNTLTALEALDVALKAQPKPMSDYRAAYVEHLEENAESVREAFTSARSYVVGFIANGEDMGFSEAEVDFLVETLAGIAESEDEAGDVGDGDPHAAWTKRVRAWGMRKGLAKSRGQLSETAKRLYVKANPADVEPVK